MRALYTRLAILFTSFIFAQSFHDTQGKLEISSSGQSTYTLPIALPATLMNVAPTINLYYASGLSGGIAGQGWNLNSISNISRIASRIDIDGLKDGVDFDGNDKLALDGQRLILKSGTYWASGSVYETEVQSNTKIEQVGSGTSIYFVVTGPDGSRSWYGNFGGQSAMDVTAWYIVRFEDIHGNFMTYHYNKPFNKSLCISEIRFSANTATNPTPLNKIVFSYTLAARNETAYLNGQLIEKVELLNKVEVFTNGLLFKKYQLTHTTDVQGYQRLTQIQEFNGANEAANPVTFEYHTTSGVTTENLKPYTDALSLTTAPSKSGDFDGDGRLDFVTGNQLFTKLFTGTTETPPITMPMNSPPYVVNTTYLGKMLQSDAFMAVVYPDDQTMQFKTWGMATPGSISVLNTKNIPINTFASITPITMTTSPYNYDCYAYVQNNRSEFLPQINVALREGDYDGDGLTDAILIRPPLDYTANIWADYDYQGPFSPPMVNSYCNISVSPNDLPTYFWVDLDPAASTTLGSQGYKQLTDTAGVLWSGSIYKADFNGDGRTDLLSFQPNGSYKVADLNLTGSTVVTNLLGQGTIPEFNPASSNIIYFGDFNGDGKTDFIKPQGNNSGCNSCTLWDIYFANVNPAGGVAFSKSSYDITTFWPYSGSTYDEQWQSNTYYVMDINKDGKSDLVRFWAKTYQASPIADPNDIDSQWKIFAFVNNIGYTGGFTQFYASTLNHDSDDNSLPVSIAADYKLNNGLEADLAVVRYHGANSFPRYTTFIDFNKDFEQDNLLKKVRQSNDAIVDEISYQPMEPTTGTNNLGALSDFYSSSEEALYPFVEIKRVATNRLVSLLKNTSLGVVKYQAFKYHGLVFRLDGQGIVGFKKTGRSTWYRTSSDKRTWAVTETDFQKRGATIRSYQKLITGSTNFAFQTTYTTGLVTKTENTYTESTDPVSQRYVLLLNTQTTTDYLTNIKVETTYNSYSTDYFLPLSVTSKNYSGATLHGSRDVVTTYDSNPTGSGNSYYIGHVTEVNTTLKTYVNTPSGGTDTKTANEKYYYTNGDLTKTEKKANASSETLVEELAYFSNGLPQSKTSSALGTNSQTAVSSRTVAYTYDTTNRFVKTTTNPDGLITTNVSYHSLYGNVLSETNIFGQATTYEYDNWGKKIKSTDFLGKSVTYTYSRTGNVFKVAEIKDDGKSTFTESDALARQTRKATTDINGNWVYSDTTYDFLGRKTGESQPYFSTSSPSLWTTYQYDDYSRVNKTTLSTGKIVTTTYSGLTTTTSDSVMTKAKTMNANGKVVTATDTPGGTITYRFDASGNMTHMIYGGNITKMDYDNWGRKVSLQDPTAGNYTYSYNAYGESISETTPNGTIKYTLDSNGRLTIKEISGTNTNTKASYTYDPTTKLLTYIKFEDFIGGYYEEMTYEYDANKMPWRTNENRFLAFHQRATLYDAFGRPERELFSAVNTTTGKQTSKWIRNTYKNGYLWQILDDATSQVLWQTNATDPLGNLTSGSLGNAVVVSNSFDGNGYPLIFRNDRVGSNPGNVSILESNFDVARGNLMSRTNNLFNRSESFQYDSLDRLTSYPDAYGNTITQSYEDDGRIKTNVLGDYNYTDTTKKYRNTSVTLNPEAIAHYANREGMFNDSMESRTGWINYFPSSITYDNTVSHTGTYSLKINNSGPGEMVINSDTWTKIDNAAATTYTYSGWVKSDGTNPQAELFLFMKSETETGYATLVDNVVTTTSTDWTYFQKTFSVPSNIKKISLRVDNNSAGVLWFDDLRIQKTSEPATTLRDLNVSYNVFKSPYEIAETGVESVGFYYNFEGSRSSMFFGGTQTDRMQRPLRRHYCFDGSMETTHNTATGAVEFVTYIGGDAYSAPIIIKSDGSTSTTYYLHRDYQGSIVAITDKDGLIVEKRLYDAWGALLKVQDKFGDALSGCGIVDRGYTGHEHLSSVGLINMNARLYDPKLHRFLQPDNFVQDPLNTQNHNRYGYCLNNPLRNTDPSGEIIQAIAISAAVALVSYLAISASQGQAITLKGAIKSVIMGAVGGAVTFGIGSATSSIAHFGLKATCQALMHGMAQGGLSALQGGGFVSGFVSGALSSLGASMWQGNGEFKGFASKLGLSDVEGMLAFGGISGAAGAALTGGNIWQGACTGIIVAGLNHALHEEFGVQYKLHVLEDYEGANGFGHQALVGDIDGKLLYVSKDGTLENGGIYGEPKYTIRPSKSFTEIDDYYSTVVSPGKHYDARLTYSVTKAQMQTALRTAIQLVKMPYNLINNSCTSIVQYSLIKAGVINHVGPIPNGAFKGMRNLRPDNSSFTTPYTDSFTIRPREWGIR